MNFLELTLPTAAENLALDEALLMEADTGQADELLRLWEYPQPAVVLGSGGSLLRDIDEAACLGDGVPVLRRASGGGTVLLGAGCLCFTLVLAYERSPELLGIRSSYEFILQRVQRGLADLVPDATLAGTSDLAAGGRKFSGNAQQRKRKFLLHHGTILYAFDVAQVGRYLRQPARQPSYREGRDHRSFLMNLPIRADELKDRLRKMWGADATACGVPLESVRQLVMSKYSKEEWIRRR